MRCDARLTAAEAAAIVKSGRDRADDLESASSVQFVSSSLEIFVPRSIAVRPYRSQSNQVLWYGQSLR